MERRKVIKFFPWVLSVFGLGVAQATEFKKNNITSNTDSNRYYYLKGNEVFLLPNHPSVGESIIFINDSHDWEKEPAVIKANGFKLNGKLNDDLLVDLNHTFGLRFLGSKTGWQYFKA